MDNLSTTPRRVQTKPDLSGQARVDLRQRDFDAVIWGKAYDVFVDKSIKCPCRNIPDNQAQLDCRNCGGTGYVFLNRVQTRAVIQSINVDTKFKEWSQELIGMAKMTFLNKERISFMDRITVVNAVMLTDQILFPKPSTQSQKIMARATYGVVFVDTCFLYIDNNTPLRKLVKDVDYTIEKGQYLILEPALYTQNCTISLRYYHHPAYHVIDLPRAVMATPEFNKNIGSTVNAEMPLLANVRLSHFVLDLNTYNGDWLFNNSTYEECSEVVTSPTSSCSIDTSQGAIPITPLGIPNIDITVNIDYYRSEYDPIGGFIYSGYLLNGTPTIKRTKDNIVEFGTNITSLETAWTNRLALTYV